MRGTGKTTRFIGQAVEDMVNDGSKIVLVFVNRAHTQHAMNQAVDMLHLNGVSIKCDRNTSSLISVNNGKEGRLWFQSLDLDPMRFRGHAIDDIRYDHYVFDIVAEANFNLQRYNYWQEFFNNYVKPRQTA